MTVELDVVEPGDADGVESAWQLKERIRKQEGVFQQRRTFFTRTYRRSRVYRIRDEEADRLLGFSALRRGGYMLFLAVAREYRGCDLGRRLVAAAADDHSTVDCHVRATNDDAIGFYEHVGFDVVRRSPSYYGDGADALYLRLDEGS